MCFIFSFMCGKVCNMLTAHSKNNLGMDLSIKYIINQKGENGIHECLIYVRVTIVLMGSKKIDFLAIISKL
jgi:hypothetical protein